MSRPSTGLLEFVWAYKPASRATRARGLLNHPEINDLGRRRVCSSLFGLTTARVCLGLQASQPGDASSRAYSTTYGIAASVELTATSTEVSSSGLQASQPSDESARRHRTTEASPAMEVSPSSSGLLYKAGVSKCRSVELGLTSWRAGGQAGRK